jgi:iron(III) transport system substrate-binding protein
MMRRTSFVCTAALVGVVAAACRSEQPSLPEVRVHATVGDDAAAVLAQAARARGVAAVKLVPTSADAEVFWLREPSEVVALGAGVRTGLPALADADARLMDPRGRFLPVVARARVLVVNPRVPLPFEPRSLRDLADPRARGRIALPSLTSDDGASTVAALTLSFGNAAVSRFLAALAENDPIITANDAEVRARVVSGDAAFGLVGSEVAAAGAASAAGLEVIVPDQDSRGAILLPTAVAVATSAGDAAAKLAHWLAGAEAEQVLVARVPGLMPLRDGVPVPVGVHPTRALRVVLIDWDRFAAEKQKVRTSLERWPEEWRR